MRLPSPTGNDTTGASRIGRSFGLGLLRPPVEEVDTPLVLVTAIGGKDGMGAADAPMTAGPRQSQADDLPARTFDDTRASCPA